MRVSSSFEAQSGRTSRSRIGQALIGLAIVTTLLLAAPGLAHGATFTNGDLAVYRIGDGTTALQENNANAVFIDEYTPAGVLVQSIPMPTAVSGSQHRFTLDANSPQEALMTRSTDERYLVAPGFDAALGAGTVAAAASSTPRVFARISGSGAADTSTALTNFGTSSNSVLLRGVASVDGSRFWMAGATGFLFTSQTGVWTAAFGASTGSQVSASGSTGARAVQIFEGQLYAGNALGGTGGIGKIGTGLPTASGQPYTALPGVPTTLKLNQLYMTDLNPAVPGIDTLYVADESSGSGAILKYAYNGSTWVAEGTATVPAATGLALRGLTGATNGKEVTLYGTLTGGINSGGQIIAYTDSTGSSTGVLSGAPKAIATAAAKEEFRGIAFAPTPGPATAPEAPGNVSAKGSEKAVTISWSAPKSDGGSPITGYTVKIVRHSGGGETTEDVSASTTSRTFTALENGVAYDLSVRANNAVGSSSYASATGNPVTPAPTPPPQPTSGPGGSATPWGSVEINFHPVASNEDLSYWSVEPRGWKGEGAAPVSVPMTVLLHGFGGTNITYNEGWATHLAEEGNYVVFPKYQSIFTPSAYYTPNTVTAIKQALVDGASRPVKPDPTLGMNLIGYSAGGAIAANIANDWATNALPKPTSLFLANAWSGVDTLLDNDMLDATLSNVPANTRVLCTVGNDDGQDETGTVGRTGCDRIWERMPQVTSREYVWMFSDAHGSPALVADHLAPGDGVSETATNALDFYGYWKLSDALRNCSMFGNDCNFLGGSAEETYMGKWSDGVPVNPLSVTSYVPACPIPNNTRGCNMTPLNVSATPGVQSVTVTWTVPTGQPTPFPKENPYVGYELRAIPVNGGPAISHQFISLATTQTLTGLASGTAYKVSVAAINQWKSNKTTTTNAPGMAQQNPLTPLPPPTAPAAPQSVTGEGHNASISVTWSAPESDGGSAITAYTVTATPHGGGTPVTDTVGAEASSDTIAGLSNGTAYDVSVSASNAAGTGPAAEATNNPITPATTPTAPQSVTGEGHNASISVAWTAPESDGGSAITAYTVTATPHGGGTPVSDTVGANATSDTLSGLTNGTAYDISVTASNAAGNSGAAEATNNPITPATTPSAPQSVTGEGHNASISVAWTAPESDGGSAITAYTVTATPHGGGTPVTDTVGPEASGDTISGLSNGTAYDISVTAVNAAGNSQAAEASNNPITPATTPDAPQNVTGEGHNASISVNWSAPESDGGSAITAYTVTATPHGGGTPVTDTVGAEASSDTIAGLSNGTAYDVSVAASNAAGTGPAAEATNNPITPATTPTAPRNVEATTENGQTTVSWLAPTDAGGSAVSSYTVTATPTGAGSVVTSTVAPSASSVVLVLQNGKTYEVSVVATNAQGNSVPAPAAQNPVTPSSAAPLFKSPTRVGVGLGGKLKLSVTAKGTPKPVISETGSSCEPGITFKAAAKSKGTISGTPTKAGACTMTFLAKSASGRATQTVTIEVLAITSASSVTFTAASAGSFTITTSNTPANPSISAKKLPVWASLHDNGNGTATLTGTPPAATSKPAAATITALSGKVRVTQTLTINVQ